MSVKNEKIPLTHSLETSTSTPLEIKDIFQICWTKRMNRNHVERLDSRFSSLWIHSVVTFSDIHRYLNSQR